MAVAVLEVKIEEYDYGVKLKITVPFLVSDCTSASNTTTSSQLTLELSRSWPFAPMYGLGRWEGKKAKRILIEEQ